MTDKTIQFTISDEHEKEMRDILVAVYNALVEKIGIMRTTISKSLNDINNSSTQLGDLAGQSRQQMIDLMADYAKAVDTMQTLNKQMMVARATAPMEAIKVAPTPNYKPVSTKDFLASADTIFKKLYEQGDIYKGAYEGWYCTPCESFWTEAQLVDGKCPDCGRDVKPAKEEACGKDSRYGYNAAAHRICSCGNGYSRYGNH